MNDGEDNTLTEAHRYSRQAEEAVKKGHWQQAIDKHSRAAQNFQACVGLTSHPAGDKVLQQLAIFHLESAERVRSRLQPQPARPVHFTPQPPLVIRLPLTTSVEFASQAQESLELPQLSSKDSDRSLIRDNQQPVEFRISPTIINIQIQNFNPIMTAKTQNHMQHLESLLSQLSLVCQSDPSDRVPKETVQLFITEMRGQLTGLRENFANPGPVLSAPTTSSNALEEKVAALERQLAAEAEIRRQQQKKLENAEVVIEKHKKRWKLLKEAAKKKDAGTQ